MRDIERRDVSVFVAPHHRARAGVEQRITPHERIQLRHPHADQAVAAVAIGKRLGKDAIQGLDIALDRLLRPGYARFRQPRSHRAIPE